MYPLTRVPEASLLESWLTPTLSDTNLSALGYSRDTVISLNLHCTSNVSKELF